jgi:hypothetical protein
MMLQVWEPMKQQKPHQTQLLQERDQLPQPLEGAMPPQEIHQVHEVLPQVRHQWHDQIHLSHQEHQLQAQEQRPKQPPQLHEEVRWHQLQAQAQHAHLVLGLLVLAQHVDEQLGSGCRDRTHHRTPGTKPRHAAPLSATGATLNGTRKRHACC